MIENAAVVGLLLAVCVLMDSVLLILSKIWPRYHPTEVKMSRWESGNLPIRNPKYTLPMQYFGFMFMFMAAEPILVILLLLSAYPTVHLYPVLLLLSLLLLLPAIYVGYKVSAGDYKLSSRTKG
ncbi:NADH-quinone oxidoreductase subunit A [Methanosarcinales archaeon]|nr:MAG: NADH-quinone oxidoreductase subunit A [Methanosarcinales archaeon]